MTVVSTSFSFQLQDMVVVVNTLCSLCLECLQSQFETFMSSIRVFKDLNVLFLLLYLLQELIMAGEIRPRSHQLSSFRKDDHQFQILVPSSRPSVPQIFSGLLQMVTANLSSAIQPAKSLKTEVLETVSSMMAQRPLVIPFPNLTINTLSVLPTPQVTVTPQNVSSSSPQVPSSQQDESMSEVGEVSSTGPAFIGQVFTMCDSSRRGLIAVRPADSLRALKFPPYWPPFLAKFSSKWLEKAMHMVLKEEMTDGPVFRFYFRKDDAAAYVKNLNLAGAMVGSCPLDVAYKYFKGKPSMFKFVADETQVKVAKKLLHKDRGARVAKTSNGVRWFRPYFFDKKQLDSLIGHSVDHYYQMLIHSRRIQRHSQVIDNGSDSFSGDPIEDDPDGLLDPPEVQELMEEMGQGGGAMEWVVLKAVEVQVQDMIDQVLLGHPLSRRLAGLQPKFPVLVDSFERRVAAAESEVIEESKVRFSKSEISTSSDESSRPGSLGAGGIGGGGEEDSSTSGRNDANSGEGEEHSRAQNNPQSKLPFNLFGQKWVSRFNPSVVFKRKDSGDARILEEDSDSDVETSTKDEEEGSERAQPKLTMMGIAMSGPMKGTNDTVLQEAMAAAAKDIEERVRKGEGSGQDHGPLFIADLGAPQEVWGREASDPSGWDEDETD